MAVYIDRTKNERARRWRAKHAPPPLPKTRAKMVRYLAKMTAVERTKAMRALIDEVRLLNEQFPGGIQ